MNNRMQFGSGRILPPAIKTILIINAIMFFLTYLMRGYHFGDVRIAEFIYQYFALFPFEGIPGLPDFYPWQLVTYQFMHANFSHIFFNLFALWMFGSELEQEWGSRKFITYYLLAGIGAGLAQLLISPMLGEFGPTVGASGAVYGIMVGFALTFPERTVMIFPIFVPIRAKFMIIGLIAFDLIMGLTDTGNVAHFAHLGGAAAGFLLLKFGDKMGIYRIFSGVKKRNQVEYGTQNTYSAPVYQMNWHAKNKEPEQRKSDPNYTISLNGEDLTQQKIDEILDKINKQGYAGLTEREKKILFELSKKIN